MPEQRSPLKEFRHLEEKLATVGLSPAEQARYRQLKEIVSPEATPRPGFDVNAAAEALKASLEPAGLRRPRPAPPEPTLAPAAAPEPAAPAFDAAPAADAGAVAWDPNARPWDPNAPAWSAEQPYDPNAPAWDPNAQPQDPNAQPWDPNAQAWSAEQPYDPNAPAWDPNAQPQDPSAQSWDPNAQAWSAEQPSDPTAYGYAAPEPGTEAAAAAELGQDPGSGALDQGPVEAGTGAPAWDAAAAGSYDQAAWDAGAALTPLDPNAAFDMTAPSFDASGQAADAGEAAGPEPAVRSYDLGPAAFDAAALPPPEPGPASYDQAPWDAAGSPPPQPAAEGPLEAEPIEAEPIEAELIEAEPIEAEPLPAEPSPGTPAPGTDFFTPGPLTPDFTGAQPLDSATFTEAEAAGASPGAAEWPEAEAAPAAADEAAPPQLEPVQAGGPGSWAGAEPGDAIDLGPVEEPAAAAEPVPLESPSEFLSSLGTAVAPEPPAAAPEPPPAPVPFAAAVAPAAEPLPEEIDISEVTIEDLPPVEAAEEISEPPAPALGGLSPHGGLSPSFVAGEHRVVVHTVEGQVLRGTITDADLDAESIPLVTSGGASPEPVAASRVKAIFFMLLPGGRPPAPEGHKVRVTFRDGRQVAGFSPDYDPEAVGFFMIPADSRTNTGRIWVYRAAVRQASVT